MSGSRVENGIEDDFGWGDTGLGQKIADCRNHGFRGQHPNFDAGEGQVLGETVERLAKSLRRDGLDAADALGGLDGEGGNGGDSVKAVGGKDFQISGDSGARGGVEAGDGEGDLRAGRIGNGGSLYHENLWTRKGFWEINPEFGLT